MANSAVYQYVRKPLDPQLIGLVVKRALEARELARRHRLLSREFKVSSQSLLLNDWHGVMFRPLSQRFEKLVFVSEKIASCAIWRGRRPRPNCRS